MTTLFASRNVIFVIINMCRDVNMGLSRDAAFLFRVIQLTSRVHRGM